MHLCCVSEQQNKEPLICKLTFSRYCSGAVKPYIKYSCLR